MLTFVLCLAYLVFITLRKRLTSIENFNLKESQCKEVENIFSIQK